MLDQLGLPELSPLVRNFEQILESLEQSDGAPGPSSLEFSKNTSEDAMSINLPNNHPTSDIAQTNERVPTTAHSLQFESQGLADYSAVNVNNYLFPDSILENYLLKGSLHDSTAIALQAHSNDSTKNVEELTALCDPSRFASGVPQLQSPTLFENVLKTPESYLLPDSLLVNSPPRFLQSNRTGSPALLPDSIENMVSEGQRNSGESAALFNLPDAFSIASQLESHHPRPNPTHALQSYLLPASVLENSRHRISQRKLTAEVESQHMFTDIGNGSYFDNAENLSTASDLSRRPTRPSNLESYEKQENSMKSFKRDFPLGGVPENAHPNLLQRYRSRAVAGRPALTDLTNATSKGRAIASGAVRNSPSEIRNRVPNRTTRRKRNAKNDDPRHPTRRRVNKHSSKCNEKNSLDLISVLDEKVGNKDHFARQHHNLPKGVIDIAALDPDSRESFVGIQKILQEERIKKGLADYMESQPQIRRHHRRIMVNWLVDCHLHMNLSSSALHLCVALMDCFLSKKRVKLSFYSALSVACAYVAAKHVEEDNDAPPAADFIRISRGDFPIDHLISFELEIAKVLDFGLSIPTPLVFLERALKAAKTVYGIDDIVEQRSKYILELAMCEYESLRYLPSLLSASALYLASRRKMPWGVSIEYYSGGYSLSRLSECAAYLHNLIIADVNTLDGQSNAVRRKYSKEQFGRVALTANM